MRMQHKTICLYSWHWYIFLWTVYKWLWRLFFESNDCLHWMHLLKTGVLCALLCRSVVLWDDKRQTKISFGYFSVGSSSNFVPFSFWCWLLEWFSKPTFVKNLLGHFSHLKNPSLWRRTSNSDNMFVVRFFLWNKRNFKWCWKV